MTKSKKIVLAVAATLVIGLLVFACVSGGSLGEVDCPKMHEVVDNHAKCDGGHELDEKGNTIIAMCHWQLLEHIDKQSRLESSCRLKNADAIRDSLMQHGVHLVLTGHFHVNGISTRHDSITGNDSIVPLVEPFEVS